MLAKLSVDQALMKAKSHAKKGEIAEAKNLYEVILYNFSQNKRAQQGLADLNKIRLLNNSQNPPKEVVDQLIKLYKQGQFSLVVEHAKALTKQYPESFIFWSILGASAAEIGMADQAIIALKKVISIKPDYADAYSNISVAYQEQGMLSKAIEACKKAISLNPNYATAYSNLGNALKDQGKFEEALEAYDKAISIKPDYADAYYNMGNTLRDKGKLRKAIDAYQKAISFEINNFLIYNNLGLTLKDQGKTKEAIAAFKKSISLNPDFKETHLNLGYTLLNDGKFRQGLEKYEWRWKTKKGMSRQRKFKQPLWDGKTSLKDKTILLWCEQGIGDTINWSAYLPFVHSHAENVILECQEKLVPLLKRSLPNVEVKVQDRSKDAERDDFDLHLPMGSLYKHFIDDIMEKGKVDSYLIPDPVRVQHWKERLRSIGKGPYIGVCWKSSVKSAYRHNIIHLF